ncbi:Two-component response regulator [Arcticibacter svalbardensis MN12-7]|uniref:Two-component response regulator n=1 Tax=Arcticibacter svalbardensis MN12-7 TaxID=1150600 RepID=R9GQE5_9SPHI|nr:response regulator transcription factor [Arcticibacter svalbardensis]EOR93943.1 Two-component response regulator [Arcticibacter svalbardensis MN12-7]
MKILIVEDEESLQKSIHQYLIAEGNVCDCSSTYNDAYQKIALYDYDCVLLDLTLPDGEGLNLLKFIKKMNKPDGVLIISARDAVDQRIEGLSLGADDYLVKPFHLSELYARITSIIRRRQFNGSDRIVFNELEIDSHAMEVKVNSHTVYFTRKEFDLLLYFMTNKSKVISKSAAAVHIWGNDADMADSFDFIYTHIKNIRKKLTDAGCKDYFHSIYGVGYKFVES